MYWKHIVVVLFLSILYCNTQAQIDLTPYKSYGIKMGVDGVSFSMKNGSPQRGVGREHNAGISVTSDPLDEKNLIVGIRYSFQKNYHIPIVKNSGITAVFGLGPVVGIELRNGNYLEEEPFNEDEVCL